MCDCKRKMSKEELLEVHCNLTEEYARLKVKNEATEEQMKELKKENRELERENEDLQNCHIKLYNDTKDEIRELKEIIKKFEEDNSKYAGANTMYIDDLEKCESLNERLHKKNQEMEAEIQRLREKCGEVPVGTTSDIRKEFSLAINKENATISLPYEDFVTRCSEKAFEEIKKGHWTGIMIKTVEEIINFPLGCKRTKDLLLDLETYEKTKSPEKITKEENKVNFESLCEELEDQQQQDCIRINDLVTTINVLSGLYANLRKNVGMD